MMAAKLSERIRPNVEAAPWVCDEVRRLEQQRDQLLEAAKLAAKVNPFGDRGNAAARDAARDAILACVLGD